MLGSILLFQEALNKQNANRLQKKVQTFFETLRSQAGETFCQFDQLMQEDPKKAMEALPSFLDSVRAKSGDRWIESLAGGPNHDVTVPLLNIVGAVYLDLDRETRTAGLRQCLSYLDGINCMYSADHVGRIDAPLLVGDIIINRPPYWAGYQEYAKALEHIKEWKNFQPLIENAKSEFWLTLSVFRQKYTSLEIRTRYFQHYPSLVDRSLDALAGILFEESSRCHENDGKTLQEDLDESFAMYDPVLHDRLHRKMEEKKWIKV